MGTIIFWVIISLAVSTIGSMVIAAATQDCDYCMLRCIGACAPPESLKLAGPDEFKLIECKTSDASVAPICQVCGEEITEPPIDILKSRVDCSRCETPHHADCWEFNGGCSVYKCGCSDLAKSGKK
jgi:hypothetical protein